MACTYQLNISGDTFTSLTCTMCSDNIVIKVISTLDMMPILSKHYNNMDHSITYLRSGVKNQLTGSVMNDRIVHLSIALSHMVLIRHTHGYLKLNPSCMTTTYSSRSQIVSSSSVYYHASHCGL